MQQELQAQAALSSDKDSLGVAQPNAAAATPQHGVERRASEAALARRIAGLLGSSKTMSPAVGLLLHFRELAAQACDRQAVLGELAAAGQLGLAMCWADQLGPTFQVLGPFKQLHWQRLPLMLKGLLRVQGEGVVQP